jgi:hypothetical protein
MKKYILLLVLGLAIIQAYSQKYGSGNYFFLWEPSPSWILTDLGEQYFTRDEINLIANCKALIFEVDVILNTRTIVAVRYSKLNVEYNEPESVPLLDKVLARKLEAMFINKLGMSKVGSLS